MAADPEISRETLPALTLVGRHWQGSYAEAAQGAVRRLIESLRSDYPEAADVPLYGLSWTDRPEGFRHFCGWPESALNRTLEPDERLTLGPLPCLTSSQPTGDATDAYARLMAHRGALGLSTPEGPTMIDEHRPDGTLRLWLPAAAP